MRREWKRGRKVSGDENLKEKGRCFERRRKRRRRQGDDDGQRARKNGGRSGW